MGATRRRATARRATARRPRGGGWFWRGRSSTRKSPESIDSVDSGDGSSDYTNDGSRESSRDSASSVSSTSSADYKSKFTEVEYLRTILVFMIAKTQAAMQNRPRSQTDEPRVDKYLAYALHVCDILEQQQQYSEAIMRHTPIVTATFAANDTLQIACTYDKLPRLLMQIIKLFKQNLVAYVHHPTTQQLQTLQGLVDTEFTARMSTNNK